MDKFVVFMKVPLAKIKKLRGKTNISIIECKKALEKTNGDLNKALEILEKKGADILAKKRGRETEEGLIGVYLHPDGKVAAMVKVSCESDFVARNEEFQKFVHELSMQIAAMAPSDTKELLVQPFIKDVRKTIKDLLKEVVAKLGENVKIEDFKRFEI